jgi:peptide deformylase
MAIRDIRVFGDSVLEKKAKEVTEVTPKIRELIKDMLDTMNDEMGVGLAAPQVGMLKRIVVINIGEEDLIFINPVILESSGEQVGMEGCLSLPGKHGTVARPNYVKVKAFDENMKEFVLEGTELLARAICHECDHLEGILYTSHVMGEVEDVPDDEYEE